MQSRTTITIFFFFYLPLFLNKLSNKTIVVLKCKGCLVLALQTGGRSFLSWKVLAIYFVFRKKVITMLSKQEVDFLFYFIYFSQWMERKTFWLLCHLHEGCCDAHLMCTSDPEEALDAECKSSVVVCYAQRELGLKTRFTLTRIKSFLLFKIMPL